MKTKARYPAATLAFYGPTDEIATKAVIGIVRREGGEVDTIHKWITALGDIRRDPIMGKAIQEFLEAHRVKSVVAMERIIGCPHEEGKDYPEGADCPLCPFWAGRDRFARKKRA